MQSAPVHSTAPASAVLAVVKRRFEADIHERLKAENLRLDGLDDRIWRRLVSALSTFARGLNDFEGKGDTKMLHRCLVNGYINNVLGVSLGLLAPLPPLSATYRTSKRSMEEVLEDVIEQLARMALDRRLRREHPHGHHPPLHIDLMPALEDIARYTGTTMLDILQRHYCPVGE